MNSENNIKEKEMGEKLEELSSVRYAKTIASELPAGIPESFLPAATTKKFHSDNIAVLEERKDFAPNDKDKFTLVVWIEGDDPDCIDDLIGGELKMHMDITEEHVQKKK